VPRDAAASVGGVSGCACDRETADRPAGSGAVCGRRVRELHVAGTDFKGPRCAQCLGKARSLGKARPGTACGAHDVAARSVVGSKSFHSAPV
jgi:hypothetical protein